MSIYGTRKTFIDKLRELMTPAIEKRLESYKFGDKLPFQPDFIKPAAYQFSYHMEDHIPQSRDELESLLYVYGHLVCDGLEKHLEYLNKAANDELASRLTSSFYVASEKS